MTTGALLAMVAVAARPPAALPSAVVVATSRGEMSVPVHVTSGQATVAAPPLATLLPLRQSVDGDWATVTFGGQPFRFLLGAAVVVDGGRVVPLTSGAHLEGDTLFLPLQWLTDYIPRRFREGYRYDPVAARFEEAGLTPVVRTRSPSPVAPNPITGLRRRHVVTVDAGHGGTDPGNPCRYCPRGLTEKDVTLQIAKQLRAELERRGIDVTMTRSKDTLIGLYDRAPYCRDECDLFVSIHVDALNPRRGYERVGGVHTYFLGDAQTEDARRVAALENDALRFEAEPPNEDAPTLFILKHLQANEILRESALLAELVQGAVAEVHPGTDRGIQQNRLVVLTTAWRPAILVETGYGTNRRDAAFLSSTAGQRALAQSIADGIVRYLRRLEAKTVAGSPP